MAKRARAVPGEAVLAAREGCDRASHPQARRELDDEPGFKLDKHRIVPGEYISFREHDGVLRTFFIKSVVDLD
jgi:hypothetical protein